MDNNNNRGILFLDEFLSKNTEKISQNSIEENCFKELYEIEEYILRKQGNKIFIAPERLFQEENAINLQRNIYDNSISKSSISKSTTSSESLKKKRSKRNEKYRPKYIRGKGAMREGLCEECNNWFRLKTSSYWYHMNFKHGIAANGKRYPEPEVYFNCGRPVSICKICNEEVSLGHNNKSLKYNWYKHFQKEHNKDYE